MNATDYLAFLTSLADDRMAIEDDVTLQFNNRLRTVRERQLALSDSADQSAAEQHARRLQTAVSLARAHEYGIPVKPAMRINELRTWFLNAEIIPPLLETTDREARDLLKGVPVGFVGLPDLDAAAIRSPSGELVIAINKGLTEILAVYARVMIETVRLPSTAQQPYYEMWCDYIANQMVKSPQWPGRTKLPDSLLDMRARIALSAVDVSAQEMYAFSCDMFTLAHEFAHIRLGHLEPARQEHVLLRVSDGRETVVNLYSTDIDKELAADAVGYSWFLRAWPRSRLREILLGGPKELHHGEFWPPLYFFELTGILEYYLDLPPQASHPSAITRGLCVISGIMKGDLVSSLHFNSDDWQNLRQSAHMHAWTFLIWERKRAAKKGDVPSEPGRVAMFIAMNMRPIVRERILSTLGSLFSFEIQPRYGAFDSWVLVVVKIRPGRFSRYLRRAISEFDAVLRAERAVWFAPPGEDVIFVGMGVADLDVREANNEAICSWLEVAVSESYRRDSASWAANLLSHVL